MAPSRPDWEPPIPAGYNDANRAFLQAFASRGSLTFREGKPIIAAILKAQRLARGRNEDEENNNERDDEQVTREQFDLFISKARQVVSPLDYDVRSTVHQITGDRVWAIVNANSDPSTHTATAHSPDEIAFVKRMLDAMFETYNTQRMEVMAITEAQARLIAKPARRASQHNGHLEDEAEDTANGTQAAATQPVDRGLKHSEVEKLLRQLVSEGWLELNQEGFYSLTARALVELSAWMQAAYNDPDADPVRDWQRIKSCEACKDIITVGQRCRDRECNVRLHDVCTEAFWRTRREKKCPRCNEPWSGKHFIGPRAMTESNKAKKAARRTTNAHAQEDNEDEDGEDDDDQPMRDGDATQGITTLNDRSGEDEDEEEVDDG